MQKGYVHFRLLFSQSLISLNLIELYLSRFEEYGWESSEDSLASLSQERWGWQRGADYFRMDGSTPVELRKQYAANFNDPENVR